MDWLGAIGLSGNQFAQGGLVLMVIGAAAAYLRKVPTYIWMGIKSRCVLSIEVTNDDRAFEWLSVWLSQQPYMNKARRLALTTIRDRADDDDDWKFKTVITPAPGLHLFWYQKRLIWFNREKKDQSAKDNSASMGLRRPETYHLTIFGRKQKVALDLVAEARKLAEETTGKVARIWTPRYDHWDRGSAVTSRSFTSVVLPEGDKEALKTDVQRFLDSRSWYQERGIPWRRGYLLHGPPGTGKSSLVGALAGHLNMNLYVLNLGASGFDDSRLVNLMSDIDEKSILLMEDLDCVAPGRTSDKPGVTLSGLLNAIDGVTAREGILLFMTTNRPETLDKALVRSGRVDFRLAFTAPTYEQVLAYLEHFYPDAEAYVIPQILPKSMAELQELCMNSPNEPPFNKEQFG